MNDEGQGIAVPTNESIEHCPIKNRPILKIRQTGDESEDRRKTGDESEDRRDKNFHPFVVRGAHGGLS